MHYEYPGEQQDIQIFSKSFFNGYEEGKLIFILVDNLPTRAPIFNSFKRIVLNCALANSVFFRCFSRKVCIRT